jgi:transposase
MVLREDKLGQSWLFPPRITDFIPEDHCCNLVVAVVERVDVSLAEQRYRSRPGNPAYSRRMLLRLVVQAAIDGVWSSRKIDKLAHENVVYMYLTGNEKPDFRTICSFRKENKELIEAVFKETVRLARSVGLLQLGHLATDGTKMKANASNDSTLSREELVEIRKIIEGGIALDEEEDKLYGELRGDELPPALNTREKIRKKLDELDQARGSRLRRVAKQLVEEHAFGEERQKERVEEQIRTAAEEFDENDLKVVSLTDPEARFMEHPQDYIKFSYNAQITADHDSGIIVAQDVTQACTDHAQVEPQVKKTEEQLGRLPEGTTWSFDNGYFSGGNLRFLERKRIDGYIPNSTQAQELKGNEVGVGPFAKEQFEYDEATDQFRCPNGKILSRKGEYEYNGKSVYAYYGANCRECPFRSECAGEGKKRVITSYGYEAERMRMAAKMRSDTGKAEYKKRSETVEWIFGNIKQNMKFREFLTRGLESVRTEYNLVCSAHNLKIIWGKLSRDAAVIGKILGSVIHLASKVGNFLRVHRIINLKCHC